MIRGAAGGAAALPAAEARPCSCVTSVTFVVSPRRTTP